MNKLNDQDPQETEQGFFQDLEREYVRKSHEPEHMYEPPAPLDPTYEPEAVPTYPDPPPTTDIPEKYEGGPTVPLSIDLQDGFSNDTVIVQVNGRVVYQKSGVSTNYALSLADSAQVEIPPGIVQLDISMPSRQMRMSAQLSMLAATNLWINVLGNNIHYEISDKPAYYM